MNTETDNKQALKDYVNSLGLTYQATFQPKPQPREKVKHPQLHWLIILSKDKQSMSVPYSEGMAHVKGYNSAGPRYQWHDDSMRKTCETGKLYKPWNNWADLGPPIGTQPSPELLDVLYCLISDASVLQYDSYEEWGPELGYDIDSRAGEKVYRQCIEQSLALKNLIGWQALEQLQQLYQDY